MKRLLYTISIMLLFGITANAQTPDWNFAGNINTAGAVLGTNDNQPLRIRTNQIQRMHINQSRTANISAFSNIVTDGYVGIGPDAPSGLWSGTGPYSLLHLNGGHYATVNPSGYRPWMKTGVTLTDYADLAYFGMRSISNPDIYELVVNWSNDASSPYGPDDMAFRFTAGDPGNIDPAVSTDLTSNKDLDGRCYRTGVGTFTNHGTDNMYVGLKEEDADRSVPSVGHGTRQMDLQMPRSLTTFRAAPHIVPFYPYLGIYETGNL